MTRKILVVDDTRNVRVLLSDFLSSHDFEVLTASDGREALDVLREVNPDLILNNLLENALCYTHEGVWDWRFVRHW